MTGAAAWADAMEALALFAVDPAGLGGLSLRAGPGPVRDHFLSLLKDALPPEVPLRRLPLHAADERVLGGLDLAATLQAGKPVVQKGLLAEADGGVVLLAMAERIEASTVAHLCAALDEGAVRLQRDGLSHVLPARLGIVALDEGSEPDERPPAKLLDRLAFHLDLTEVSARDVGDPDWSAGALSAARTRLCVPASGVGDAASGMRDTASGMGDSSSELADTASGVGDTASGVGDTASGMWDSASRLADTASGGGDTASGMRGTASGVGDTVSGSAFFRPLPGLPQLSAALPDQPPPVADGWGKPGHDGAHASRDADMSDPAAPTSPSDAAEALCCAATALGIDSIRAPLLALRAARIAAALAGRDTPNDTDLGLAARLVFVSRATRFPPPQDAEQPPPEPEPAPEQPDQPPPPDDAAENQDIIPDQPLADIVLQAAVAALPPDLLARLAQQDAGRGQARATGRAQQTRASTKRGRPIGTRYGEPKNGNRLHLLETLKAAAPWQTIRRRTVGNAPPDSGMFDAPLRSGTTNAPLRSGTANAPLRFETANAPLRSGIAAPPARFEVRRDDFRIIRFRQRIGTTTIFAVDASGSAAMQRLGEAKGAVELLLADCYVRRDQVALIAFRGQGATILLPPTGSLVRAKRSLAGLPGGGPTPLAAGIDAAVGLALAVRRTGRTPVITILTDARANIARDGSGGRPRAEAESLESGRLLRNTGIASLLVDTSPRPNPFARRLAEEMHAQYVPLPYADASALSRAVRAAAA